MPSNPTTIEYIARRRSGFSLIELLVVIFLTTVLLTLLLGPLIQGFNLTSRAQTTTQAQDSARLAMEQISREIGSAAAVRDTSRQYLSLLMFTPNAPQTETVAHAYNAYLDIVPPRPASSTTGAYVADPTVDPSSPTSKLVQSTNGSWILTPVDLGLPIAPGTVIVRYFVGLRHPINLNYTPTGTNAAVQQPYVNVDERQTLAAGDPTWGTTQTVQEHLNNPYILYRAEVSPYTKQSGTGAFVVNSDYFAADSSGQPELDDPDFFRVLSAGDPDASGMTAAQITAHNQRVYYWTQVAKPIIDINNVNLIFQPHDSRGNVEYDPITGYLLGTTTDTDGAPIIRTSVSFEPAPVSNDPLRAVASSDVGQGYGSTPGDALAYVPTQYVGRFGEWQGGPNVVVAGGGKSFSTYLYTGPGSGSEKTGDLIESYYNGTTSTDVYDISQGIVLGGATNYVAMSVNGNSGTVDFAVPDLPGINNSSTTNGVNPDGTAYQNTVGTADPTNPNNPYYAITFGAADESNTLQIDLEDQGVAGDPNLLPGTLLSTVTPTPAGDIPNGRVVVNSESVYGPDETAGPADTGLNPLPANPVDYELVPYRRIAYDPGGTIGRNEYMIDYDTGIVYLGSNVTPGTVPNAPDRRTFLVAFSYQNNDAITPSTGAPPITGDVPDTVQASYQTGSRMMVSIGLRLYDPTNGQPSYFSMSSGVDVGNSSR